MFGRGGKAIRRSEISSLKASRLGRRHPGGDPGVFPWTLDDASPARIARHVEHRRKSQGDPVLRSLFGGDARRLLPQIRRELARFRQRHGENRVVAMDDVKTHEERNAETGFLHREALDSTRFVRAPEVEQVSDPPGSNPLLQVSKLAWTGHHAGRSDHIELPDLFL